jgi:hypothetical protein
MDEPSCMSAWCTCSWHRFRYITKGLPSSLHTIAARERVVVTLTFIDTRTLTPYTRSRYLAVHVPNVMLFVLPTSFDTLAATVHACNLLRSRRSCIYVILSPRFTHEHRHSTELSSGAIISRYTSSPRRLVPLSMPHVNSSEPFWWQKTLQTGNGPLLEEVFPHL